MNSENNFENLSCLGFNGSSSDLGFGSNMQPVGILSNQNMNSSCFSSSYSNYQMMKPKKSILKYKFDPIRKSLVSPYQSFSVTPLLNIDTETHSSTSIKNSRKIPKVPFKVLDAPSL
jgi:hypothetical protein